MHDPTQLPPSLPVPQDDGACDHLGERPFDRWPPGLRLESTGGGRIGLCDVYGGELSTGVVVFFYPRTGVPGQPPSAGFAGEDWDEIPGARGCTPQSCGFGDAHTEFAAMGLQVFGVSTNTTEHQREFRDRMKLPFEFLSDSQLELVRTMGLPTFEFPVESGGPTTLVKRMAWYLERREGGLRIAKVWYPVYPSSANAATVLAWLREREARAERVAMALRTRRGRTRISIRPITEKDRPALMSVLQEHFGGGLISSRGKWIDAGALPGLVAEIDGRVVGMLTHTPMESKRECELVTLVALTEAEGVGSVLLAACVARAQDAECSRVFLTTSNDNIDAIRLYQRRGWRLCAVYPNALAEARRLKPHIPTHGPSGIEIRDDLEFEVTITAHQCTGGTPVAPD